MPKVKNIEVAEWDINTFDLGKHWPEFGDYQAWHDKAIESAKRLIEIVSEEVYQSDSGATGLLVKGIRKEALSEYRDGKRCPECGRSNPKRFNPEPFKSPDDVAIHLLDEHGWDYEHARLWLRDKVEETSLNQPA